MELVRGLLHLGLSYRNYFIFTIENRLFTSMTSANDALHVVELQEGV